MTTVITKATPADLLAALPAFVGGDARNSVVLIAFRGKRTHAGLRFDIPRSGEKRFAATALGLFCKIEGADDVVPVISSDAPLGTHRALMTTLVRRFRQAGFAVRDALTVGSDGWVSHYDPDARARPLTDIAEAASRLAIDTPAEMPARVLPADEFARRRMSDELARLRMLVAEDGDLEAFEPIADLPFFAEGALTWTEAEFADRSALLLFALQGPPARDLVMLQWAFGLEFGDAIWSADTCAGTEACKVYADVDSLAAERILGHGPSPDVERVEAAIALLAALIARAEDADRPAPLCMLAWLTWARGRGSVAGAHLDEVRTIAPDYSMGQLLGSVFGAGILPEWVFIRPEIR
jgi:hypothetical protein